MSADPELAPFLAHLRAHGARLRVADDLVREPDQPGLPHAEPRDEHVVRVPGLPPLVERRAGRCASDHATWSVAAALVRRALVPAGGVVWDVGCGTGVLAIVAALLGARRVVALDVDADALALTQRNAAAAGVELATYASSLLDDVPATEPPADLMLANLPHKPSAPGAGLPLAEDGGPEGDALFAPFLAAARTRLAPRGALAFFQHSLPHPRWLAALSHEFDLELLSWKRRLLAADEYGPLRESFRARHAAGTSYVGSAPDAAYLVACVWHARRA